MKYAAPLGSADHNAPYVDANPSASIEGSPVPAAAIEPPMREIVAVIVAAGFTPSATDLTQLYKAIVALSGTRLPEPAANNMLAGNAAGAWALKTPAEVLDILGVGAASTSLAGLIEIATQAEVNAGADGARAVTPAHRASQTNYGVTRLATAAEAAAGVNNAVAATPAQVALATGAYLPLGGGTMSGDLTFSNLAVISSNQAQLSFKAGNSQTYQKSVGLYNNNNGNGNFSPNTADTGAIDLGHGAAQWRNGYFSGDVSAANFIGAATTAITLQTARTVQVNLAAAAAASFNGSANITPGVTGVLPVANGGTGAATAAAACAGIGALPLGGGTMSGDLTFSNQAAISSNQAFLALKVGNSQTYQKSVGLYNNNNGNGNFSPNTADTGTIDLGYGAAQWRNGYFSGNVSAASFIGTATTAITLQTARTVQVNLAAAAAASFNGSANITPGVTGILPVANGGTGVNNAAVAVAWWQSDDGKSWYVKFSNGFIIQAGRSGPVSGVTGATITLYTPFSGADTYFASYSVLSGGAMQYNSGRCTLLSGAQFTWSSAAAESTTVAWLAMGV